MNLTQHFTLEEFERSATATKNGIDNSIPQELIPSIQNLCEQVLEPLRQHIGKPITITSGYRSKELNNLIGGSPTSQHLTGQAADFVLPSTALMHKCFTYIKENCTFDQLIWERSGTTKWLHVSCKPTPNLNRKQAFQLYK